MYVKTFHKSFKILSSSLYADDFIPSSRNTDCTFKIKQHLHYFISQDLSLENGKQKLLTITEKVGRTLIFTLKK